MLSLSVPLPSPLKCEKARTEKEKSAHQEESSHREATTLAPSSGASGLQSCLINACCLSCPLCGILSWRSSQDCMSLGGLCLLCFPARSFLSFPLRLTAAPHTVQKMARGGQAVPQLSPSRKGPSSGSPVKSCEGSPLSAAPLVSVCGPACWGCVPLDGLSCSGPSRLSAKGSGRPSVGTQHGS